MGGHAEDAEITRCDRGMERETGVSSEVTDTVEALVLDLLEWVSLRERTYEETMEAWRTSCPRLPVWEDANELRLVCVEGRSGGSVVRVTAAGREFLKTRRQ